MPNFNLKLGKNEKKIKRKQNKKKKEAERVRGIRKRARKGAAKSNWRSLSQTSLAAAGG